MPDEGTNNASPETGPNTARPGRAPPQPYLAVPRRLITAAVTIAVLAVGAAGGAGAYRYVERQHPHGVLLLQPAPVAQTDPGPVAVKGQVAEIFGNKFIIQDDSGRALVETGPRGEDGDLVTKGETITIQGRFDNGFIHAEVMTRADGTSEAFGPPRPPRPERGPGPGRDLPPPPGR